MYSSVVNVCALCYSIRKETKFEQSYYILTAAPRNNEQTARDQSTSQRTIECNGLLMNGMSKFVIIIYLDCTRVWIKIVIIINTAGGI